MSAQGNIILIILAIFAVIVLQFYYFGRKQRQEFLKKAKEEFGTIPIRKYAPGEMERIARYYENHKQLEKNKIDDITWHDLDMDKVFQMLNRTYSAIGEEYLYYILRTPQMEEAVLKERERLIVYFKEHEEKRLALSLLYHQIGRMKRFSVSDVWEEIKHAPIKGNGKHYAMLSGLLLSFGSIFLVPSIGILLFIGAFAVSIIGYYHEKGEMEAYVSGIRQIIGMLSFAEELERLSVPELEAYVDELRAAKKRLSLVERNIGLLSGGNMTGSLLDSLMEYIRILTHVDLIKLNSILHVFKKEEEAVEVLFRTLGFIESMLAIASYRTAKQGYCIPKLMKENKLTLSVKHAVHPLMDDAVANSIDVCRGILITGSNASGKSTFLKTLAVNAILAQTIHTAAAAEYAGSYAYIMSSMALTDNLAGKESYYMVEIKSLKRILDMAGQNIPVFCFLDEVLRGTNTVERIAASAQILNSLSAKNVLCFAATHDMELTHLLENVYENYYFQEQVLKEDIRFDYKLHKGRAVSKNAIKLLGMMGYRPQLIKKAEACAEHFVASGEWKL